VWDRARPAGAVGHGVRAQALDGSRIGRAYYDWWTQRAVLAPHRKTVAAINDEVVKLFAGRMTCLSEDVVNDADDSGRHHGTGVGPDTLALNWPPGAAPHELSLAPGMPIMCLLNFGGIDVMNGTRMIITELKCHSDGRVLFLSCCFYDVSGRLRQVDIPRVPVQVTQSDMPFVWTRKQFPVMLCFAMTINKSQGQTLPARVGVVATSHVFAHGQLYVALGRVTHPDNLRVWTLCDKAFVRNVVYADIVAKGVARVD
jgi:ATP-dependent DNA helicase PIF1